MISEMVQSDIKFIKLIMSKDYSFNLKKKKYGLLVIMVWLVKQLLKNLKIKNLMY